MKKFLAVMLGSVLLLGACGEANDEPEAPADDANNVEETEDAGGEGTYDLANGEQAYQNSCIGCHGGDLEGASGPGLVGTSYDDVLHAIQNGPGSMPADLVTGTDAEDLAAWVADQ